MNTVLTREGAIRQAAEMAADGQDTRHLADEQSAYADEIETVTRLVWDDQIDVDVAVARVLATTTEVVCPICGKVNKSANDEGHTDGPREYHAECWAGTICGKQVKHDNSGVGHNWRNIHPDNIPADIQEEIAAEIIDGKQDTCDDYCATNGLHYRW